MLALSVLVFAGVPVLLTSDGITDFDFLRYLTALQKSFDFLGFNLLKKFLLALRSKDTVLFLACLYFEKSPETLPNLYKWFLFLIDWTNFFESHGRFLREGRVFLGMHSSIIETNLWLHLTQDSLTSLPRRLSQSISSQALSQSACLYIQTLRPLEVFGQFALAEDLQSS